MNIKDYTKKLEELRPARRKLAAKKKRLRKEYDLSYETWMNMWTEQGGTCAICDEVFTAPETAQVDHDHETGRVRGLLCLKCNIGLGGFRDSQDLLARAQQYLDDYS